MVQKISLLVYIDSQMCKLTIRMHFDQSNAVQLRRGGGPGEGGGQGQPSKKTLKNSLTAYEKEDFRLFSKHQLYKCIYSWLEL